MIRKRWQAVWNAILEDGCFNQSSYISYALWQQTCRHIEQYAGGVGLDLGAGKLTYRAAFAGSLTHYISLDVICEHPELDMIGSGEHLPLASNSLDTVLSTHVLEHIPHPWHVIGEIARVLKPGGVLIMSVPFIFYIHGGPHDYFRFTPYAVRRLLEDCGLAIDSVESLGGVWAFVGLVIQTALVGISYGIPVIGTVCWETNRLLTVIIGFVDRHLGMAHLFPMSVLVVAHRPSLTQ